MQADILAALAIVFISGFVAYNHMGRDSPEGWFRFPPEPSWFLDPPAPKHTPKDAAALERLNKRIAARQAQERVAIVYRLREVARQWTAVWVAVFFYPSFSCHGILVIVEERRAAWQQPAKVWFGAKVFEYVAWVPCAYHGHFNWV